jgi:hypothetical protein
MITEEDWSGQQPHAVHLTGIHVPFWSVVGFMVKWSIASIPALLIVAVIELAFIALSIALFIGVFDYFHPGELSVLMGLFRNLAPGAQSQ